MSTNVCRQENAGSALLLVIWAVFLLLVAGMGASFMVLNSLENSTEDTRVQEALVLAESALALAFHPDIRKADPLLSRSVGEQGWEVEIFSEASRIPLNAVLMREDRVLLERLFALWGVPKSESDRVIDCLLDWVDEDDLPRLQGAERDEYVREGRTIMPRNRRFTSPEQIPHVLNIEIIDGYQPNWMEAFSIYHTGGIDVRDASAELIAAATDLPLEAVQRFVRQREEGDWLFETSQQEGVDPIQLLARYVGRLDLNTEYLASNSGLRRAMIRAWSGSVEVRLEAVKELGSDRFYYYNQTWDLQ
ncbi:MAG: general secretion pathway protein GspK [Verrucomicrobiales bacterium]